MFKYIILLLTTCVAGGASLIVDTFEGEEYHLLTGGFSNVGSVVVGPLSDRRTVRIRSRGVSEGAFLEAYQRNGALNFHANSGGVASPVVLDLRISYTTGGPNGSGAFSLGEIDGFLLKMTDVYGVGYLIIEVGSGRVEYGNDVFRTLIDESGEVFVPVSNLTYGSGGSLESSYHIHFVFESHSPAFGFGLGQISIIPEPKIFLFAGITSFLLLRRFKN